MTLPEYFEISECWERWPPLHILIPAYLGVKTKESGKPAHAMDEEKLAELLGIFGVDPGQARPEK